MRMRHRTSTAIPHHFVLKTEPCVPFRSSTSRFATGRRPQCDRPDRVSVDRPMYLYCMRSETGTPHLVYLPRAAPRRTHPTAAGDSAVVSVLVESLSSQSDDMSVASSVVLRASKVAAAVAGGGRTPARVLTTGPRRAPSAVRCTRITHRERPASNVQRPASDAATSQRTLMPTLTAPAPALPESRGHGGRCGHWAMCRFESMSRARTTRIRTYRARARGRRRSLPGFCCLCPRRSARADQTSPRPPRPFEVCGPFPVPATPQASRPHLSSQRPAHAYWAASAAALVRPRASPHGTRRTTHGGHRAKKFPVRHQEKERRTDADTGIRCFASQLLQRVTDAGRSRGGRGAKAKGEEASFFSKMSRQGRDVEGKIKAAVRSAA
ncbi:hypothetical protein C8Q78DRAFT_585505 [Trametes maxima]|nr:hypothetical protein C8Q78DRAFT_585505 [Trametes maxima]